jgi:ankyrin repeat protein
MSTSASAEEILFTQILGTLEKIQDKNLQADRYKTVFNHSLLHRPASMGYIKICRFLLQKFPKLISTKSMYGRTPLHFAASNGQADVCKLLIDEFGADTSVTDKENQTPFSIAALNGHTETCQVFLERGFDIKSVDESTYVKIVKQGFYNVVEFLCSWDAFFLSTFAKISSNLDFESSKKCLRIVEREFAFCLFCLAN